MELEDLEAKVRGSRTLMHTIGKRVFTLVTPTSVQCDRAFLQVGVDTKKITAAGYAVWRRELLDMSLTQWSGVTEDDVLPPDCRNDETAATPLPLSARSVALYMDANPDHAIELATKLFDHMHARRVALEQARKN